jgi:hypothetical protein
VGAAVIHTRAPSTATHAVPAEWIGRRRSPRDLTRLLEWSRRTPPVPSISGR